MTLPALFTGPTACCAYGCRGILQDWSLVVTAPLWITFCLVHTRQRCVVSAQAPAAKTLFNRAEELNCLERLLSSPPGSMGITVIVGPPSCGKTALVEHYLVRQKQPQPPLHINCRVQAVHTPDSLARTLLSSTESAGERFVDLVVASAKVLFSGLSNKWLHGDQTMELKLSSLAGLIDDLKARPGSALIADVLELFMKALRQTAAQGRPTHIIIDEANKLTNWSSAHPVELDMLLSFFVAVSKEQDLAHVLLLTSDYAYINWLKKGKHRGPMVAVSLCQC